MRTRLTAALAVCLVGGCTGEGTPAGTTDSSNSNSDSASASATDSASSTTSATATTSATTGATATTGPVPGTDCASNMDCQFVNDCCSCEAMGADDTPTPCPEQECFASTCEATGLGETSAACRIGRCELSSVRCNPAEVACDSEPPPCENGQVPSVVAGCWGGCIDARYCDQIPSCQGNPCGPGWFCVESQAGTPPACHPAPLQCVDNVSCECVAPFSDEFCPGACAVLAPGHLLCQDGG